jgi:Na+-driven multidrug efflux pump
VLIKRRDHGLGYTFLSFLPFFGLAFAAAFFALAFALLPPILNILVPQIEHVPDVALRPFFIVICFSPFISLFFLHFTQYPCVTKVDQPKLK